MLGRQQGSAKVMREREKNLDGNLSFLNVHTSSG